MPVIGPSTIRRTRANWRPAGAPDVRRDVLVGRLTVASIATGVTASGVEFRERTSSLETWPAFAEVRPPNDLFGNLGSDGCLRGDSRLS